MKPIPWILSSTALSVQAGFHDGLWWIDIRSCTVTLYSRGLPSSGLCRSDPGIHEYIRYIVEPEPGILWLSPSDKGPIRITFKGSGFNDPIVEKFDNSHGLPSGGVTIYNTVRGLTFLTKRGVYTFDPDKKRFSPDPFYNAVNLGRNPDEGVVVSDHNGNIWANLGRETVLFEKQPNGDFLLKKEILVRFADDPAASIYPEKDGNIWFGTTNYATRLSPDRTMTELSSFPALIRRISINNDSIIYNGNQTCLQ